MSAPARGSEWELARGSESAWESELASGSASALELASVSASDLESASGSALELGSVSVLALVLASARAQGSAESAWKSDAYDRDDGACGVLFSLPCSALLLAPRPDTDDPESSIRT